MQYFPLFLDLHGRPVLVVGGGVVAARKVSLLLDAGAAVTVVAPALDAALRAPALEGRFTWHEARFEPGLIAGQRLVVAATDDRAVNAEVAAACEQAGLPVNVVDDPELSNAIVPAIVDRSPLVIAVSSAGTAPMLARAVREKLETLVDESFGSLARLLGRARRRIVERLPDAAARRRFYGEALAGEVASLVRAGRDADADVALDAALERATQGAGTAHRGRVLLVGAGPGDPGLLTLRALRALQEADVVLHDSLVSRGVLDLARRDARRIDVGKQGGGRSVPQSSTNALLLELAREGLTVVRLKGGDPFVFGRGAEELRVLRAAGIPCEVVPGITAAVGAAAYAGIPLTDREHAAAVRFVTAQRAPDSAADGTVRLAPGLEAHGASDDTLAIYMGRGALQETARALLRGGRAPRTPVALVEHATRPEQRVFTSTLGALAAAAPAQVLRGPVILLVGEAVSLSDSLHWFGPAPEPLFAGDARVARGTDDASANGVRVDRVAPSETSVLGVHGGIAFAQLPHPAATASATAAVAAAVTAARGGFDFRAFFGESLDQLRREHRYRSFRQLGRELAPGPVAFTELDGVRRAVTVWCSNDYLGMSRHPLVLEASRAALARYGAGAGGTRNIAGTHDPIVALEAELASLHAKDAALVFSSGYVANDTVLATLAAKLPRCIVFSDADNHASMIEGLRRSRAEVQVFAHNDPAALAALLAQADPARPKIVAFESLYSMNGDVAPLRELVAVARRHGALTYVDETHAVGVHGATGGGLLEAHGLLDQVDLVQGGLGKGYGVVGGFVTGACDLIDFVRSHAPGFIFTTALPPAVAAAALASVRHLRTSQVERQALRRRVDALRARLQAANLPLLPATAQILPLLIGDSARCTLVADRLLREYGIYLQPINYPTVARGAERLRITPSPLHDEAMSEALLAALVAIVPSLPRDAPGASAAGSGASATLA